MTASFFSMFFIGRPQQTLARRWLWTAVAALALAGLFSILLVLARTPVLQDIVPYRDFFHTALVVHVDLSVLVWFLAVAGLLWTLHSEAENLIACHFAWGSFVAGTALLVLTPFLGEGHPLMNNYVPVLQQPLFFAALSLLLFGIMLQALHATVYGVLRVDGKLSPRHLGVWSAAWITLAALIAMALSYRGVSPDLRGQYFYELLFWGGGHILQYTHVQLLTVCWCALLVAAHPHWRPSRGAWTALYAAGFAIGVSGLALYPLAAVESAEHRLFFTEHMRWLGGTAPLLAGILLFVPLCRLRFPLSATTRPLLACLLMSLLLFAAGGVIGYLIQGVNVTIPAHYHGSIVGVTLAFMGLIYLLLPALGYGAAAGRLAVWQPVLYGAGQLMHIIGLAWSGGYGAIRKSADTVLDPAIRTAMGLMGIGGLLAVLGGLLFVLVCWRSARKA